MARFLRGAAEEVRPLDVRDLVIAGWTGRDRRRVREHIEELKALGVAPPTTTPLFYRISASRLTFSASIETCGDNSSGEVEAVVVAHGGSLWVGAGSDHTDRSVEAYSVAVSKQMCDKPLAAELWAFDDVAPHWDSLALRSWAVKNGERQLYQEGNVSALLDPRELIDRNGGLAPGTAMFCGTLPAIGGVRPAEAFVFELEDPVLGRTIHHEYSLRVLPVVS